MPWYITEEGYSDAHEITIRGEYEEYEDGICPDCDEPTYRVYEGYSQCYSCGWDSRPRCPHCGEIL